MSLYVITYFAIISVTIMYLYYYRDSLFEKIFKIVLMHQKSCNLYSCVI